MTGPIESNSEDPPVRYPGLFTRATALLIDAVAINVISLVVGATVDVVVSAFGHHRGLHLGHALVGGAIWAVWVVLYFVVFWTLTGQTPGNRVMGIRVLRASGGLISAPQGLLRVVGTVIAVIPLFAGFLPVLVDTRRRGLNDWIAHTVVVWVDTD